MPDERGETQEQRLQRLPAHQEDPYDFLKGLDPEYDAFDVGKGSHGTFYIQTNSPNGHAAVRLWMHPHFAIKLRDWLNENYPSAGVESELRKAQEDTARLDWLSYDVMNNERGSLFIPSLRGKSGKLRQMIDAARAGKDQKANETA